MAENPYKHPPKPRRLLRFSLRALLLITAAIAVWLGVQVNKAQKQRAAVAAIEEAGGSVWATRQIYPEWLGNIIGNEYINSPTAILIDSAGVTPEIIIQLGFLPSLKEVFIIGGPIPDVVDDLSGIEVYHFAVSYEQPGVAGW